MSLTYERVQSHLERLKLKRVAELIDPIAEDASQDKNWRPRADSGAQIPPVLLKYV